MMAKKCIGSKVIATLLVVGGLNWGLIGLFDWNLVNALFGSVAWLERAVYILVGVAAVMSIFHCKCKMCKGNWGTKADDMSCGDGGCGDCHCKDGACKCEVKK